MWTEGSTLSPPSTFFLYAVSSMKTKHCQKWLLPLRTSFFNHLRPDPCCSTSITKSYQPACQPWVILKLVSQIRSLLKSASLGFLKFSLLLSENNMRFVAVVWYVCANCELILIMKAQDLKKKRIEFKFRSRTISNVCWWCKGDNG